MPPRRHDAEPNTHGLPTGEPLRRALARVFREQRTRILDWLKTGRKSAAGDGLPPGFPDFADFGLGALDLAGRMTPLITLTWEAAAAKFAPKVGLDPNAWTVVNPHTERMIQEAAFAFSAKTNATTTKSLGKALADLRAELTAGVVERGETLTQLTRRVQAIFDGAETYRARAIAQTETSRAVHAADEQAAIASGVVTGWEWLLSEDACPLCQTVARRAKFVKLGQPFATDSKAPAAYRDIRFPPLHPHCNCTVVPVLDTDPQPEWAATLHDPQPGTEDKPAPKPKAPPKPKPAPAPPEPVSIPPEPSMLELPARSPSVDTPAEPIPEYLPSDADLEKPKKPAKPKPPKAPPKPKAPKPDAWPETVSGLRVVRKLGGSTGAELVEDPATGKRYVRKSGANPGHLREEAAADALYRVMGIDVPPGKLYETSSGPVKLTEYREGLSLNAIEHVDANRYKAAVAKLRKGFVADALLGNWDVIGAAADNVLVTAAGDVLRIDNGGSLRYRAQGSRKPGSQWSGAVGELASLRDPAINPAAAKVFGGLSDAEVKAQAKALLRKRARILAAAPEDLRDTLAARLDSLDAFAKAKAPKPEKNADGWTPTPADRFKRVGNVNEWGKRHFEPWVKTLSQAELDAVKTYTGSSYVAINRYLRGQTTQPPAGGKPMLDALDRALAKGKAPDDIIVYRGVQLSGILGDPAMAARGVRRREDLKPGMDLIDPGYTSTSPASGSAFSGTKLEIRVPKGTPGAYVDSVSKHTGEREFLLARTVDRLRIVEIHPDRIVVEALQSSELAKPKGRARP